jgi:D-serine deaminase-like pyridoxal phosphate-dependent protein
VIFPDLPDVRFIAHNEEHLLVESSFAARLAVGGALLGVPWHVCPTVALHAEAVVIERGRAAGERRIDGRARKITV